MRWLALSLALFVGIAASQEPAPGSRKGVSENKADPKKADKKANPEQRGTEQAPIFVKTPGPSTQAERDHEAYEKHEKPTLDRILSYATALLVIVTAALACFTYWLWSATKTLVEDSGKNAQRQLRPYVGVKHGKILNLKAGLFPEAQITVRNAGQTPAYKINSGNMMSLIASTQELPRIVLEDNRALVY